VKAVLLRKSAAPGVIGAEVSEVPVPEIGTGELLVEMKACGLCGTDIEKARGEYTAALPVLGHEAVGVVASVGESVVNIREGDRVFAHHHVPCQECYYCLHGNQTACKKFRSSNIHPGGFSEFFRVPQWNVSKGGVLSLPSFLGFEEASLIEPVGCCVRALDRCNVKEGDAVLVVGAGPIGILHSILLLSRGAKVMISEVSEPRLRFAEKSKAGYVIDARKQDVTREVSERTAGRGADIVIVASGSPKAVLQALKSIRMGGRICLFGVPAKGSVLDYDLSEVYNSEVSLVPSYGATDIDTTAALSLIVADSEKFRSVITHTFPISEFAKAVETTTSGAGMKVVITP
jgi:L-iditol 2-dehydrogenase